MIVADWRRADAATLQSCYEQEAQHWRAELGWDTADTWLTIEEARLTWGLPGLIAFDGPHVQGWTFYTRETDRLEVGALVSRSPDTTSRLLESVLEAGKDLAFASCFVLDRAPNLRVELTRRGFDVEDYFYLSRPLAPAPVDTPLERSRVTADGWRDDDVEPAAALLCAAYTPEAARHFAPHGSAGEWRRYVRNLVDHTGCGILDPWSTRVVRSGNRMTGLVLVTAVGPTTAHVAQLAVHPDHRRQKLAQRLIDEASALAASTGREEITLLVGESNIAARRLYERLGFTRRATFIAAHLQHQPAEG
jgi:ribosomal protein S18 acetylase RimI-like enzyme